MLNQPPGWNRLTPTVGVLGRVTAPTAGQVVADSGALPAGIYDVEVSGSYGGTADVIDNMAFVKGGKTLMPLPVIPVANSSPVPVRFLGLAVYEGEHLQVVAVAAGGVGTVFRGVISATPQQTIDIV